MLDTEQSYERVNLNFLMKVMECIGFRATWIRWICECIFYGKILSFGEWGFDRLFFRVIGV